MYSHFSSFPSGVHFPLPRRHLTYGISSLRLFKISLKSTLSNLSVYLSPGRAETTTAKATKLIKTATLILKKNIFGLWFYFFSGARPTLDQWPVWYAPSQLILSFILTRIPMFLRNGKRVSCENLRHSNWHKYTMSSICFSSVAWRLALSLMNYKGEVFRRHSWLTEVCHVNIVLIN